MPLPCKALHEVSIQIDFGNSAPETAWHDAAKPLHVFNKTRSYTLNKFQQKNTHVVELHVFAQPSSLHRHTNNKCQNMHAAVKVLQKQHSCHE